VALPYDPLEVERRWQRRWDDDGLYEIDVAAAGGARAPAGPPRAWSEGSGCPLPCDDKPFYNLVEFPYPSAQGLHVGHVMTYCGADVVGRYQRMRGRTVFQPLGFDAFGINAENYALKAGEHPATLIARTVASYRSQLATVGCGWDWGHTVVTSDPSYYRWTQWLFLTLFRAGLAYRAEAPVVWCPSCATVLAREQLEDDACERCGTAATERVLRQWFLRITAYRDRLAAGLDGLDWPEPAKNTQRRWLGGLHDWLISRQRYWGPPIPIVHCPTCGPVEVPDDQLPVLLPEVADPARIRPTGDGTSPLATVEAFVATTCPACGGPARRETDVSDTFFDSSWYFLRYPSSDVGEAAWEPARTAAVLPVDLYAGGPEHVARHHLYARFVTMALHDLGLVPFEEPFPRLRLHGFLTRNGAKMSKSRGNVVNPEAYVARHGGDVLRTHLLSTGRWSADADFDDARIGEVERLFTRLWRLVAGELDGPGVGADGLASAAGRVATAIRDMRFHAGIGAVRELAWRASAAEASSVVLLLAPFAPYLAEELWARSGGSYSVHRQQWPEMGGAPSPAGGMLVVQVDGRVRDRVAVPKDLPASSARALAEASPIVARHLAGRRVARCVYVPGRLVNLVTTEGSSGTDEPPA
jgi:leucyl-tRNA synthetase